MNKSPSGKFSGACSLNIICSHHDSAIFCRTTCRFLRRHFHFLWIWNFWLRFYFCFIYLSMKFMNYLFLNVLVCKNGPAVSWTRVSSVFGVATTALKLNNFPACKRGILPLDYRPLLYLSLIWFLNFYFWNLF